MSTIAAPRDVRVTARKATPKDFIAPEMSPVRTADLEAEKGTKGWTDLDVKCPDLRGTHLANGHADREIEALNVGVMIRKAPTPKSRVVSLDRPRISRTR